MPFAQSYSGAVFLHVRLIREDLTAGAAIIGTLRQSLRAVDPNLPILRVESLCISWKRMFVFGQCARGVMFGVFGGIALLLAVVGVLRCESLLDGATNEGDRNPHGSWGRCSDVFALIMKQGALQTAFAVQSESSSTRYGRLFQMLYQVIRPIRWL